MGDMADDIINGYLEWRIGLPLSRRQRAEAERRRQEAADAERYENTAESCNRVADKLANRKKETGR